MLLGIPGDNTYANYQEASRVFWRQTVLPLVNRTAAALSAWLAPGFETSSGFSLAARDTGADGGSWLTAAGGGGPLELRPDLDAVDALNFEREALWARLERASFLTDDEKRSAVGYGPKGEPGSDKPA
jgi:phage portal protein BeeE